MRKDPRDTNKQWPTGCGLAPELQEYLDRTFRERVERDELLASWTTRMGQDFDPPGVRSIREFIGTVARLGVSTDPSAPKPPVITDFQQTLASLLRAPMRLPAGEHVATGVLLIAFVLGPMVLDMLRRFSVPAIDTTDRERELLELASKTRNGLEPDPLASTQGALIVDHLLGVFLTEIGARTLRSFFVNESEPGKLLRWWPGASTDIGEPLKRHEVATPFGPAEVEVQRYDTEGLAINAYEWRAVIPDATSDLPLAVACGMSYVFQRDRSGRAYAGKAGLVDASDMVSDTDVSQVRAFLEQHADALAMMRQSDLCFVWIWERQSQSPKGAGAAVLSAALRDLKKRFPRMYTAVLSVEPYQFRSSAGNLPPTILNEQLEAHDRLHEYCASMGGALPMELKLTTARQMRPGEALKYLGQVTVEDLARRGELAASLTGLDDLAVAFRGQPGR